MKKFLILIVVVFNLGHSKIEFKPDYPIVNNLSGADSIYTETQGWINNVEYLGINSNRVYYTYYDMYNYKIFVSSINCEEVTKIISKDKEIKFNCYEYTYKVDANVDQESKYSKMTPLETKHTLGTGILFGLTGEHTNPQSRISLSMYYYNNTFPIGIYFDWGGTGDFQSCENCYEFDDVYVESVLGDQFQEEDWAYTKTTIGTIVNISKYNFSIYGGLGFGEKSIGHRYYDSYHILGDSGRYWIESDTESLSSLSLGLIKYINMSKWEMPNSDIGIQIGYETMPKSIMLGITLQQATK